jgi:hypothetical protein
MYVPMFAEVHSDAMNFFLSFRKKLCHLCFHRINNNSVVVVTSTSIAPYKLLTPFPWRDSNPRSSVFEAETQTTLPGRQGVCLCLLRRE